MKIILIRHGESRSNEAGTVTGHMDSKLTEKGIEQARQLAEKLRGVHIDIIYASPLSRAADTAKEIAKYHRGIRTVFRKELVERYGAAWEGMKIADLKEYSKRYELGYKPGGTGETVEEVHERLRLLINEIFDKHRYDTVAIVTHGSVGRIFTTMFKGVELKDAGKMKLLDNAGVDVFELNELPSRNL